MELVDLELRPSLSEQNSLPSTIRFEFLVVFARRKASGSGILVKRSSALLPGRNIAQGLEIVVQEVCVPEMSSDIV